MAIMLGDADRPRVSGMDHNIHYLQGDGESFGL